ncbi:dienelactone hydrolase family protein [Chitinasiproducens palmae]|uniref:dienelactone hydrolase family protein n=1 Tax=Chitinasiproducens palmae TaxID=1770053 RepID=UPI0014819473|nr:CocE/NonD family hydrolase [Chitinasiproducens palmae]
MPGVDGIGCLALLGLNGLNGLIGRKGREDREGREGRIGPIGAALVCASLLVQLAWGGAGSAHAATGAVPTPLAARAAPEAAWRVAPPAGDAGRTALRRVDAGMNEEVVMLPTPGGGMLETTLFRPDGPGPFPILIYNHGKERGLPAHQARARPLPVAREFVSRGYLVAVPMRRGFAQSSGSYDEMPCDAAENGRRQADDIADAVAALSRLPYADAGRIVLLGASYGGLATIAYADRPNSGVRGVINFSGGLRQTGCADWEADLIEAFSLYGRAARLPSLWLYGANDQLWPHGLGFDMFAAYAAGGSRATLVDFGPYKDDSHRLLGDRDGVSTWWPPVAAFLTRVGMPTAPRYAVDTRHSPAPSGYADVHDVTAPPFLDPAGRSAYLDFLRQYPSRAFALSASGAWAWAEGGDDPMSVALDTCQQRSRAPCRLYAVDNAVVWNRYADPGR